MTLNSKAINRLVAIAIFLISLSLTFEFAHRTGSSFKHQKEAEIIHDLNDEISAISERLRSHEHFLRASAALFSASDSVNVDEWTRFVNKNNSISLLPGLHDAGFIRKENHNIYAVHFHKRNCEFCNNNDGISKDSILNEAMYRAASRNVASLAFLKSDSSCNSEGFMFVPVYSDRNFGIGSDKPSDSVYGWVYTTFTPGSIVENMNSIDSILHFRLFISDPLITDSLLYDSNPDGSYPFTESETVIFPFDFNGTKFSFHFLNLKQPLPFFAGQPLINIITGSAISIILYFLILFILEINSRSKKKNKQLQEQLTESEKLRSRIFDSANVGFSFIDMNGNILMINSWWVEKTGYTAEELKTMTSHDLTHPEHREMNDTMIKRVFSGEVKSFRVKKRYLKKDGTDFWGDLSFSSLKQSAETDKLILIGVVTDITASIRFEEFIKQKTSEQEKLITERNHFISTLAHDLKSPFNSMLGFSNLMVENIDSYDIEKIRNSISIINFTVNQTYDLFNDIISWAKIQSGRLSFNPKILSFNEIYFETVKVLKLQAENKNLTIRQDFKEEYKVFADPGMLKSVLRNLLSNSLKFTEMDGHINVRCFAAGTSGKEMPENMISYFKQNPSHMIVSVTDTGIGIEPEKLRTLFNLPAEHISRGTDNEQGSGLGLMLCREFISRHGGSIWVESEPGKGSSFYFSLPRSCRVL